MATRERTIRPILNRIVPLDVLHDQTSLCAAARFRQIVGRRKDRLPVVAGTEKRPRLRRFRFPTGAMKSWTSALGTSRPIQTLVTAGRLFRVVSARSSTAATRWEWPAGSSCGRSPRPISRTPPWYDEERPGLAARFLSDVGRTLMRIRERRLHRNHHGHNQPGIDAAGREWR